MSLSNMAWNCSSRGALFLALALICCIVSFHERPVAQASPHGIYKRSFAGGAIGLGELIHGVKEFLADDNAYVRNTRVPLL